MGPPARSINLEHQGLTQFDALDRIAGQTLDPDVTCQEIYEDYVSCKGVREIDVDARDADEETPLRLAARAGHVKAVKHLCEICASVNADGANGKIPFHCAAINEHAPIAWLGMYKGDDKSKEENGSELALRYLEMQMQVIKYKADLAEKDTIKDPTALLKAFCHDQFGIADVLLEAGALVDVVDKGMHPALKRLAAQGKRSNGLLASQCKSED
ncbi:MAG: hypothetical protein ASARMPREDX12_005572 [Alectoria sarmentosa]|nr:MAG: hypothetical protein ASARMPREDX12_005572 [Alectoria sarmentosa]